MVVLAEDVHREQSRRMRSAEQVTEAIFADQAERKREPFVNIEPESWRKRWLASQKFYLMEVPIACVAMPCSPRDMNCMLARINENMDYNDRIYPVTVDVNKPGIGKTKDGFVPPITVVDGKHRFAAASLRGSQHITAWVGELAAERIGQRMKFVRNPPEQWRSHPYVPKTAMDTTMTLHADSAPTVEPLHHILGRELGQDPVQVRDLIAKYKQVESHGRFGALKERMNAVSPPGWSHTVEKMKNHPEISNPFALAWHMHDQGMRPHKGKD